MRSVTYAVSSFTIPPGQIVAIVRDSGFVTCLNASDTFKIRFDDGTENDFEAGLTYRPDAGFNRLAMRNPGATPITVRLGFGKGAITDARLTLSGQIASRETAPDVFTAGPSISAVNAATTALVAGPDPLRREVILTTPAGAGTVYLSGNTAAVAGEGFPLLGGQSITLQTGGAIYARNDTGAAVAVSVATVGWSA